VIPAPLLLVILTLNPSPFVILSEESNPAQGKLCGESYGAQDRLREGEEFSPFANAQGDKKPQRAIDIFVIYDINLT